MSTWFALVLVMYLEFTKEQPFTPNKIRIVLKISLVLKALLLHAGEVEDTTGLNFFNVSFLKFNKLKLGFVDPSYRQQMLLQSTAVFVIVLRPSK